MSWDDEMVTVVRELLSDFSSTTTGAVEKYSDDRLSEAILVGALGVLRVTSFKQTYTVNVPNLTLRPDPTFRGTATLPSTRDDDFIYLTTLKTACNLVRAEIRDYTSQGISIRDGTSAIALQRNAASLKLMSQTYCDTYEAAIYFYALNRTDGSAVFGPHGSQDFASWYYWGYDNPYGGPCSRGNRGNIF